MRVRSHWFRGGEGKPPEVVAHAAAVIAWRLARAALSELRAADFDVKVGSPYFGFLAEYLAYLVAIADRVAFASCDPATRAQLIPALARKLAELLAENEVELLGQDSGSAFIERCNARAEAYADCDYHEGQPGFVFLRCFATFLAEHLAERDWPWVHAQVMEIQGPRAAATLREALHDLLGLAARKPHAAVSALGD